MNTERNFDDLFSDFLMDELDADFDSLDNNVVEQPLCEILPDLVPYTSRGTTYYVPTECNPQYYFHRLTIYVKNERLSSDGEQKSLILEDKSIGENDMLMQWEDVALKNEGLDYTDKVSLYLYRVTK